MARMKKRADGRYTSSLTYVNPMTRKEERKFVYGKTQAEVRDKLQALHDRIAEGAPVKDSSRLVRDWSKQWRTTSLVASDRRESTQAVTDSLLRNHVEPSEFGALRLDRITLSDVERFIIELRDKQTSRGTRRLKESSISRIFQVMKVLFDDAIAHGLIAKNPIDSLKRKPKADDEEKRYLTNSEVSLLLSATEKTRYFLPLQFIASTGLRKGELIGLRWDDFDRTSKNPNFTVSRTVSRLNGRLLVGPVKTKAGRRTIPLTKETLHMLSLQEKAQKADMKRAGKAWVNNGHVFTTETGQLMDPRNVLRAVTTAAAKVGLVDVDVHSIRHGAVTAMLEAGIHIKAVSVLVGHSNVATTAKIYAHVSDNVSRTAMQALSDAMSVR